MQTQDLERLQRIRDAARRRAHELRDEALDRAWRRLIAFLRDPLRGRGLPLAGGAAAHHRGRATA